jgi:hypothetical protein
MDLKEYQRKLEARRWWHWDSLRWIPYRCWMRAKDTYYEIKWGLQRMFRGYDDTALWSLDSYLTPIVLPVLKEMRQHCYGLPHNEATVTSFTEEEWNATLDRMIFSFQYMYDEDHMLNGFHDGAYSAAFWRDNKEKINEGLTLFGKHFQALWT